MTQISDAEMHRRIDDLANNCERGTLTPIHYHKTIQAIINFLAAQKHYDEKPGFWRQQKLEWAMAGVRPGVERLGYAYQALYGPLDMASTEQFWDVLKAQARNVIIKQVQKMG